jgi:hypothetical protein
MLFEIKKLSRLSLIGCESFKHEQANLCVANQTCFSYRCKKDSRASTQNPTIRTKEKMTITSLKQCNSTFQDFVEAAIRYIDKHGERQSVIDKLETMLPGAWAAEVIAEALDEIQAR